MPRKNKLDKQLDKLFTYIVNSSQTFLEKLTPRDMIYILAYAAAVQICYNAQVGIGQAIDFILYFPSYLMQAITGKKSVLIPDRPDDFVIDWNHMTRAFVAAYILLKLDISDITSALGAVGQAVGLAGGSTTLA